MLLAMAGAVGSILVSVLAPDVAMANVDQRGGITYSAPGHDYGAEVVREFDAAGNPTIEHYVWCGVDISTGKAREGIVYGSYSYATHTYSPRRFMLPPDANNGDPMEICDPSLLVDAGGQDNGHTWKYALYYGNDHKVTGDGYVRLAVSDNLIDFQRATIIFPDTIGSAKYGAGQPSAVKLPNNNIRLFYRDNSTGYEGVYYIDSVD